MTREPGQLRLIQASRQRRRAIVVFCACVSSVLTSCAGEAVNREGIQLQHWRITAQPDFSIGAVEGDDRYLFGGVTGAVLTAAGNVAVLDRAAQSLIIYDSTGSFVRRSGGTGNGPGEFRIPLVPTPYRGDSIAVYDGLLRRVSIFDGTGIHGRDVRIEATPPAPGREFKPSQGCCLAYVSFASGSFILDYPPMIPLHAGGPRHALATLVHLSPEGSVNDTLGHFPARYYYHSATEGGMVTAHRLSLPHLYAPLGESLLIGNGERPELMRVTRESIDTIRLAMTQRPVTPELKAAIAAGYESGYARFPRNFEAPPNVSGEYMPNVPAFVRVQTSPDSSIWLEQWKVPYSGEATTYFIFALDGRQIADMSLPDGALLASIGRSAVLLIEKDSLDVQYVRRYQIVR